MRIIVCVKQVYDPASVKLSRSREEFDLRQAVKLLNRPDRYALEAALRLQETEGGEVIALTAGDAGAEDVVHEAIAMGAGRGILLAGPELAAAGGAGVAKAIAAAVQRLAPVDLVLTGSGDPVAGTGSLPGRLGAALDWPVVLDAACLEHGAGGLQAVVPEAHGAHAVPLAGPAVVEIIPGLDRPRYAHAQRIANAYKPGLVEIWHPAGLGIDDEALAPDTEANGLVFGPERSRGQRLGGDPAEAAAAVIEVLRTRRIL